MNNKYRYACLILCYYLLRVQHYYTASKIHWPYIININKKRYQTTTPVKILNPQKVYLKKPLKNH